MNIKSKFVNYRFYILTFLCLSFLSCNYEYVEQPTNNDLDNQLTYKLIKTSQSGELEHYILPSREDLSKIPQDPKNPLTYEKIELGQYLFFETGLAQLPKLSEHVGTWSCATCHIPEAGFRPGVPQGIADGGVGYGNNGQGRKKRDSYSAMEIDAQGIRPLTVLNVAMYSNTQWAGQFGGNFLNEGTEHLWNEEDGSISNELGYYGLETQNIEGLILHRMDMNKDLAEELGYKELYDRAFPEFSSNNRYSLETTSLALSAYLRSLLTTKAPFQNWLKGNKQAMTEEQKLGAIVFFGKGGCYKCHKNANLGANEFHAVGVKDLDQTGGLQVIDNHRKNLGRGFFTKDPMDNYKFKVPQLYNLKDAVPYFHGGSAETIEEVINYFEVAKPENERVNIENISPSFLPLTLSEIEKNNLKIFIEEALFDSYLERYVPPYLKSGNCFPNNDIESRKDLNCD